MLKKIYTLLTISFILLLPNFANAHDSNIPIRVGISTNDFSKFVYGSAEFSANGNFEIIDIASGRIIPNLTSEDIIKVSIKNGCYTIYKNQNLNTTNLYGPIVIKPKQTSTFIAVHNLKRSGNQAYYRGIIELTKKTGNENLFCIVNVLDLENYLKGVVPNEMPIRFGLEALKAQTVAARNYALRPREKFYSEFDVCDSVACQVYFGAATEKELSNTAIKQTNGIVALSPEEELILALYSSTAGGYTENYEYTFSDPKTRAFPTKAISYLKAKPDYKTMSSLADEESAKAFFLSYPDSFDSQSPYFRWEREWKFDELEQVLKKTLIDQSKTGFIKPSFTNSDDFGTLKDLKVIKRGESGKIISLNIITDKGSYCVSKELVIRRTLQKNGKALPSANFVIDIVGNDDNKKIILHGAGFGHGAGLSQFGAGGMAAKGYKFDEILQHYYTGISLATMPVELTTEEIKNTADQTFYASSKKAFLRINNPDGIDELTVMINGKEFKPDISDSTKKKFKIDISEYVNVGQNTIVYCIPKLENRKKTMRVYVEIKEAKNE